MQATKKPVTINFIEWTGDNLYEVIKFITGANPDIKNNMASQWWEDYKDLVKRDGLIIKTLEGQHIASIGDMIIQGVSGEFYPCKPEIFALTYDIHTEKMEQK